MINGTDATEGYFTLYCEVCLVVGGEGGEERRGRIRGGEWREREQNDGQRGAEK